MTVNSVETSTDQWTVEGGRWGGPHTPADVWNSFKQENTPNPSPYFDTYDCTWPYFCYCTYFWVFICRLWIGAISVCTQSITPKYLLKVLLFCYRKMKQIECTARTKTLPAVIHPCYAFPAAKWPPSKVYYLKTVHMQEQCCVKNLCSCSAIKRLAHSFLCVSEKSDLNFWSANWFWIPVFIAGSLPWRTSRSLRVH